MTDGTAAADAEVFDFLPGDVNEDDEINIMDVILLNEYNIGVKNLSSRALLAADLNGDGVVDATDSLLLLKKVVE